MELEKILVEERRNLLFSKEDYAFVTTNTLNRTSQGSLLALPFLVAGLLSVFSLKVALFVFGFSCLLIYAHVVQSRFVITRKSISKESRLLDFTFGTQSVPLSEVERGMIIIERGRSGESVYLEFPHASGSIKIEGLQNQDECEELLQFFEKLKATVTAETEAG